MLEYVLRAVAVPGLNTQQQIEVTLECGLRCHRLGMWRKYALFLYIAALMSADNENYGVAHALVSQLLVFLSCWLQCTRAQANHVVLQFHNCMFVSTKSLQN